MQNTVKIIVLSLLLLVIGIVLFGRSKPAVHQGNNQDRSATDAIVQQSINYRDFYVSQSSDDAEEGVDGSVDLANEDLDLGQLSGFESAKSIGVRYEKINLTKDQIIEDAFIEFTMEGNSKKSKPTELTIHAELSPHSETFAREPLSISSRRLTQSSVMWSPETWNPKSSEGTKPRTPNLSPVIQEVISLDGWQEGNPITFIITGNGERDAVSFDGGGSTMGPVLRVEVQ